MMDFTKFVEWAFLLIISGSITWCAAFLSKISQSVGNLNIKLAVVLERLAYQEKEINNHGNRLNRLEGEKNG